jgi:hypothetical protein
MQGREGVLPKNCMEEASLFSRTEVTVQSAVEWLRLLIESMGALVIAAGIVVAIVLLLRSALARRGLTDFTQVRLAFARPANLLASNRQLARPHGALR